MQARDAPQADEIRIPCVDAPPVIDGVLDDSVWGDAAVITEFHQVEPIAGAEPSQKTEVRVAYTPDAIYFAMRVFHDPPRQIRAATQVRDGDQRRDDRIQILLGTFNNARDSFLFEINPLGSRTDILIENNTTLFKEWDGIWDGKARRTDDGWVAEVVIPFKTIAFKKGEKRWEFNIVRTIQHTNEEIRWSGISQNLPAISIARVGHLAGLQNIDLGWGLDVRVSASFGHLDDPVADQSKAIFEPNLDAFYRITPSLTGSLTVNTDFAEAAVDERQINLTRFNLFFPETRAFFLQDAGIFEFGDLNETERNGRPFFSRRIGLADGEVVDIIGGAKLTGRVGDVKLGFLDIQTESTDKLRSKNLSVGRIAVNILEESAVGAIVTNGDPTRNGSNTLVGADFRYRNSDFLDGRVLTGSLWFQKSFTSGVGDEQLAWGGALAYPNDRINWKLVFKDLGENFQPALGFVNRVGIRTYKASFRRRWRPEKMIRTIDLFAFAEVVTDRDNAVESIKTVSSLEVTTNAADAVAVDFEMRHEKIRHPFFLPHGIRIGVGEYTFVRPELEIETSRSRAIAFEAEISCCEFFDGRNFSIESNLEFFPSEYFFIRLRYDHDDIDVPGGEGTVRIGAFEFNLNLTPDLQWANIVQYDNVSDDVGIQSRLRWILKPGSEIFLIVNQDFLVEDWDFRHQRREATVKIGHTIRL